MAQMSVEIIVEPSAQPTKRRGPPAPILTKRDSCVALSEKRRSFMVMGGTLGSNSDTDGHVDLNNRRRRSTVCPPQVLAGDGPSTIIEGALYLGDAKNLVCECEENALGIRNFLIVAKEVEVPACASDTFNVMKLSLSDGPSTNLHDHFDTVFEFIEGARARDEKVLVCCRKGMSRSASLVVAYLMWSEDKTFEEAKEVVRSYRSVIDLNIVFAQQLMSYEAEIFRAYE